MTPARHDTSRTVPWLVQGTELFLSTLDRLPDDALRAPSGLPGWSRAHLLAHVARNAEALVRLLHWARTGEPTPMYADPEQRDRDIERGADQSADALRDDVRSTADQLDQALRALPDAAWDAEVRTARGRAVPAPEVPWMRVREVWLHAVDLAAGAGMHQLPAPVVEAMLDDVTQAYGARPDVPALVLTDPTTSRTWRVHEPEQAQPVDAPAYALLALLVGRPVGTGVLPDDAPTVPAWL